MIRRNWLERLTLTVSSIVVVATFGYLSILAMDGDRGEARLVVSVGEISRSGDQYAVSLVIRNEGGETAENVRVDVSLESPGGQTEKAELRIPYVPYKSEQQGTALFTLDPRQGRLKARARAFQTP